jgi:quercetin dioxygenase-like cupin family protein
VADPDLARLAELVGDVDAFASTCWGRRPLHRRADAELTALLDVAAVERLLAGSLRHPAFRLVRDGTTLPRERSTRRVRIGGRWVEDVADPQAVAAAVGDGATLVLQSLHRHWPPLAELCRALERATSHPCQANAYLTPAGAAGLGRHHDEHEVLVLQVEGRKAWEVDGLGSLELVAGDVLYVPAGTAHEARTQDGPSLHLTVGILAVTTGAVVRRALDRLDDGHGRPLPLGYARPERADALAAAVADACGSAADALAAASADEVAAHERRRARTRRPTEPARHLRTLLELDQLDAAWVVRSLVGPEALCEGRPDGRVALDLADQRLVLPAQASAALRRLVQREPVRVGELPGLSAASQLVVVRRLLREGVVEVASDAAVTDGALAPPDVDRRPSDQPEGWIRAGGSP